jgi:hypothetical protein
MSKYLVIQALFGGFFGLLLLRLAVLAHRGQVPRNRAVIWTMVWGVGLALVMSPALSYKLARVLGVTRGTDAVTYTAIAFLSVMVFRAFQLIDVQDGQLSRLTTELALYEWEHRRAGMTISGPPGTPRGAAPLVPAAEAPE